MIIAGFNPYLTTPDYQMEMGILSNFPNQIELYEGMGTLSASHYTNYPPLNQLCFILANLFPGKSILSSVIGMRLIIIAADLGTLYFGKKLLERFKLPSNRIFWYILNPFIIIEFTGNLHFEGVMIFFLIWSLYLLHSGKWKWAAVILGCSISVKLIPLMFLPLFFWWFMGPKKQEKPFFTRMTKLIGFYFITITTVIAFFFPFISMELINNYSKTVGLWFGNFEFNASIYYLAREIGYAITGYNEIAIITKILPVISILVILGFALFKSNNTIPKLSTSILLAFTLYLFLSTTVHPWYLSTLVILGVFTNYRYPIIWSLVIILSYLSYLSIGTSDKSENLWIIGLEYGIIFAAFIWEILLKKPIKI
jgi:Gpi18-like mannosyltransferase